MKKIEYILSEYGFVFKIVLSILWVLWAVQFFSPMKKIILEERTYQKTRDPEAERKEILAVRKFAKEKLKQAEAEGISYGPQEYFEDLKEIVEMVELRKTIRPNAEITRLMHLSWNNVNKGHYSMKDIEKASSVYERWCEENLADRESLKEITWQKALSYLITFYRRSIFLVLFFYLTRMAERKGVLATILAEKKKLVLAVILWPAYFFKYPYNVVREIRVEAELRRLKGLFRVFTARESRLVREIANSSYYKQWIAEFHQQDRSNFQRGLFVAIVATLFLHLLFSSNLRASEKRVRSPGLIVIAAGDRIETSQNLTEDAPEDNQQVEQWAIPPGIEFFEPLLLIVIVRFLKDIWYSKEPGSIDRVPRSSLFGVFNFINQTMKGTKNEHGQENNLLSDFTGWSRRICLCS